MSKQSISDVLDTAGAPPIPFLGRRRLRSVTRPIFSIVLLTLLAGCGGSSGGGDGYDSGVPSGTGGTGGTGGTSGTGETGGTGSGTARGATIHSFKVVLPSSSAELAQVLPTQDDGEFALTWSVSAATDPFHIDIYVSNDQTLQTATDVRIFSQNCGSAPMFVCGNDPASAICNYGTDNRVSCGMLTASNPTVTNLSLFLSTATRPTHLILRACDGHIPQTCADATTPVEFH